MNTNATKPIIHQAIETRYLSATNTRSSRIKASCDRGSIVVEWDYDLDVTENHIRAAKRLCAKFADQDKKEYGTPLNENPWSCHFVTGGTNKGCVHVFQS